MSRRRNFQQSNWLIELSPRKNVEPRIVGICSTFRIIFHILYFHILNIFIQGTNSILFYNLALFKSKYLRNYLQINWIKIYTSDDNKLSTKLKIFVPQLSQP